MAVPFAKGFGWGGELNLEYVFEKLFGFGHGQGYPPERVEPEMRNKRILDKVSLEVFIMTYEKVFEVFRDYLVEDDSREVLTSRFNFCPCEQ